MHSIDDNGSWEQAVNHYSEKVRRIPVAPLVIWLFGPPSDSRVRFRASFMVLSGPHE